MKAEFGRAKPSGRARRRTLLLFVTLFALLIILLDLLTSGTIGSLVRDAASGLWSSGQGAASAIAESSLFTSKKTLEDQINALQAQLEENAAKAAAFSVVEEQNQQLSQLVHLAQTNAGVSAPVTSSVIASPYGTFAIGAGSAEGLSRGDLALSPEGFVVGIVSEVSSHSSLVEEAFAAGVSVNAVIDGNPVTVAGEGGVNALARLPNGLKISVGDPVTVPAWGNRAVGTVGHINSNPANAQMEVYISLPESISQLPYVYVIHS